MNSQKTLAIIGRSPIAVQHGVFTLLRSLGCRWYYPGDEWTILPHAKTVTVAMNRVDQPDFLYRRIFYGRATRDNFKQQLERWEDANRMGSALSGGISHSYHNYVPRSLYKTHPDYFALRDTNGDGIGDKRTSRQPDTTNPAVVKLFIKGALAKLAKDPGLDILAISPNDNTSNMDRGPGSRAVGNYSDTALLLANQVAAAIKPKYPHTYVGFYAYGVVAKAPAKTPPPAKPANIIIELATAFNPGTNINKMLKNWAPYAAMLGIRDYFAIDGWGANDAGGGLQPAKAARIIPYYYANKVRLVNAEAVDAWGGPGPGMYLSSELMWHHDADAKQIMSRFYSDCFGKGAAWMQKYFEFWEGDKTVNLRRLKVAMQYVNKAYDAAQSLDNKRRIATYGLFMHEKKIRYALNQSDSDHASDAFQQKVAKADNFLWRFKDTQMTFVRTGWQVQKDGTPYFMTKDAIGILHNDLKEMADVQAVTYKADYGKKLIVAPATVAAAPPGSTAISWVKVRRNSTVVVKLKAGQKLPLSFGRISKGTKTLKISMKSAAAGAVTQRQRLTQNANGPVSSTLTAGKAGLYAVRVPRADFRIENNTPYVLAIGKNPFDTSKGTEEFSDHTHGSFYLYVPKGTKAFALRTRTAQGRTMRITFVNAKGSVITSLKPTDGEYKVTVPEDSQGQIWRMDFNAANGKNEISVKGIPPYLSTSPGQMLIPGG